MKQVVFIAMLVLADCAAPGFNGNDGYTWVLAHEPLPYRWQVVDQETLQARCHGHRGWTVNGCALYLDGLCVIVAQEDEAHTPAWLRDHELKHCAGWNHIEP